MLLSSRADKRFLCACAGFFLFFLCFSSWFLLCVHDPPFDFHLSVLFFFFYLLLTQEITFFFSFFFFISVLTLFFRSFYVDLQKNVQQKKKAFLWFSICVFAPFFLCLFIVSDLSQSGNQVLWLLDFCRRTLHYLVSFFYAFPPFSLFWNRPCRFDEREKTKADSRSKI